MSDDYDEIYEGDDLELIPKSMRKLRSCIGCGLIMEDEMWHRQENCQNCQFSHFDVNKYTSASFSGMLAIFQPKKSWCAQWQKFHFNKPGLYALDNEGEVTDEIIDELSQNERPFPEWVERAAQKDKKLGH